MFPWRSAGVPLIRLHDLGKVTFGATEMITEREETLRAGAPATVLHVGRQGNFTIFCFFFFFFFFFWRQARLKTSPLPQPYPLGTNRPHCYNWPETVV